MRAVQFEQPDLVATVAKSDEILAKDFNTLRHVAELTRNNHRLPKPPQVFAARRARPDSGQLLVHRRYTAVLISAVGLVQKRQSLGHWHLHSRIRLARQMRYHSGLKSGLSAE